MELVALNLRNEPRAKLIYQIKEGKGNDKKGVAPIFIRVLADGKEHRYCGDHDPISREEFEKIWGITAEMKKPRDKRMRLK